MGWGDYTKTTSGTDPRGWNPDKVKGQYVLSEGVALTSAERNAMIDELYKLGYWSWTDLANLDDVQLRSLYKNKPAATGPEQDASAVISNLQYYQLVAAAVEAGISVEGKTIEQLQKEVAAHLAKLQSGEGADTGEDGGGTGTDTNVNLYEPGPMPSTTPYEGYEWVIVNDQLGVHWEQQPKKLGPRPTEFAGWGQEWVGDESKGQWQKQGMTMQDLVAQQQWAMNPYNWVNVALMNMALPQEQQQYNSYVPESVGRLVSGLEPGQSAWDMSGSASYKTGLPSMQDWGSMSATEQQQLKGWIDSPLSPETWEDWWGNTQKAAPPSGYSGWLRHK